MFVTQIAIFEVENLRRRRKTFQTPLCLLAVKLFYDKSPVSETLWSGLVAILEAVARDHFLTSYHKQFLLFLLHKSEVLTSLVIKILPAGICSHSSYRELLDYTDG